MDRGAGNEQVCDRVGSSSGGAYVCKQRDRSE
jgi:hypothetical protein